MNLNTVSLLILFTCVSLVGCKDFLEEFDPSNTHLEGRLIAGNFPSSPQIHAGDRFQIEIEPNRNYRKALIKATSVDKETLFQIEFKISRLGKVSVRLPYNDQIYHLTESSLNIHKPGLSRCFDGTSTLTISLCLGGRDFSLTVLEPDGKTRIQLYGGLSSRETLQLEEPRKIALTTALNRALNQNFQSLYDFQTTIQAYNTSMANKLNLLPHFRFLNAVGLFTMAEPVLISSAGDWAPFLFPSRWFKASEGVNQDYATRLGFQIVQANLAQQVQILALAFRHDKNKLQYIVQMQRRLDQFLEKVKDCTSELRNTPVLHSIVADREALDRDHSQMSALINADRAALSMALGYLNPKAVEDLEIDVPYVPIDEPKVYDSTELIGRALEASLELKQLHFIRNALKSKKGSIGFNWFDPSGSADLALGFNLLPQLKNVSSEMEQIATKAGAIRQQITHTAQLIERSTARSKTNFKEIQDTLNAEVAKIEEHLIRIHRGFASDSAKYPLFEIAVNEVLKSFHKTLQLQLEQETEILNWELGQVREERLLLIQRSRLTPHPRTMELAQATNGEDSQN